MALYTSTQFKNGSNVVVCCYLQRSIWDGNIYHARKSDRQWQASVGV